MSRLILLLLLVAALVAAATMVATVFSGGSRGTAGVPAPRSGRVGTLQKAAWGLLFVLMAGVGSGWLGPE